MEVGTVALTKHGNSKGHKFAQEKLNLFVQKDTKINTVIVKASEKEKKLECNARLTYSLRCLRFLLRQGLACCGMMKVKNLTIEETFLSS